MATRLDWKAIERDFARQVDATTDLALDRERIDGFARGIATGAIGPGVNRFDRVEPAGPDRVDALGRMSEVERERLAERGRDAIARGAIAVAVLNGGMATRFGGDVKGILEAVGGRSFLEIKLAQARVLGDVPFVAMNSFATHARTLAFLEARGLRERVDTFVQNVSLRLTPEGEVFRDADGAISPYAPGHGDFPECLRRSGQLERLRARGVEHVLLSNIDNLGAELDPLIVGYHLDRGRPITTEVAATVPGDAGGAPAIAEGRLQIVEQFRFPPDFDFATVPFMATNTFVFSLDVLEQPHELTWFYVEKKVDGQAAVQMERLVNELTSFVDSAFLATPRGGPQGRFFPIKTRDDLAALRADARLVERFSAA